MCLQTINATSNDLILNPLNFSFAIFDEDYENTINHTLTNLNGSEQFCLQFQNGTTLNFIIEIDDFLDSEQEYYLTENLDLRIQMDPSYRRFSSKPVSFCTEKSKYSNDCVRAYILSNTIPRVCFFITYF